MTLQLNGKAINKIKAIAILVIMLAQLILPSIKVLATEDNETNTLLDNDYATAYLFEDKLVVTEFKKDEDNLNTVVYPWYTKLNKDEEYSLVIEDGIEFIGSSAFYGLDNITGSLELPDSVKEIKQGAFAGTNITGSLELPEVMVKIGDKAFTDCTGLTGELVIPDSVTEIGKRAFQGCENITGLKLSDSIEILEDDVFEGCTGLTGDLIIPEATTTIGKRAFRNCESLGSNLVIPDATTTIDEEAFGNCPNITTITVGNGVEELSNLGSGVFFTKEEVITDITTENEYAKDYPFEKDNRLIYQDITFNINDEIHTEKVLTGEKIEEPEQPVIEGYEFIGWYTEDDKRWDFDNDTVSEEVVLSAKWESAPLQIEIEPIIEYTNNGTNNGTSNNTNEKSMMQKFIEAVKSIITVLVISLLVLAIILALILLILNWMKRVTLLNDQNTDEYKDEDYRVVHKTVIKTEGNPIAEILKKQDRVWTISIPYSVIKERVTEDFQINLNKFFCERYNGEQLIVVIDTDDEDKINIGQVIDKGESKIKFVYEGEQ